jgi:hypothetical protein
MLLLAVLLFLAMLTTVPSVILAAHVILWHLTGVVTLMVRA